MERWHIQLIETVAAVIVYFIARFGFRYLVRRTGVRLQYQVGRITLMKRILSAILLLVFGIFILFVWGVEQSQVLLFFTSILTVLGIAFFAQWSIISNITSSLIIFFNHPIRVGDHITILDHDFEISGTVSDIGLYFLIIITDDNDRITVPSNLFMQKMVKKRQIEE